MYLSSRPDLDNTLDPQLPGGWSELREGTSSDHYLSSSTSRHAPYSTRSHTSRQQRGSRRPHRGRYEPRNPSYKLSRDELREIANLTLDVLDEGWYVPPGYNEPYNLMEKMQRTNENTAYYPPDDVGIAGWATADLNVPEGSEGKTRILIKEYSTLVGARKLHGFVHLTWEIENKTIGVLNFASAKKPGGGFLNGAQAQEESIARVSTLYPSLISPTAKTFYSHYVDNPNNAMYNHAMVYSPGIVLIRNDKGEWKKPVEVDVLTSAAVNAGEVRDQIQWQAKMRSVRARYRAAEGAKAKLQEKKQKDAEEERRKVDETIKRAGDEARRKARDENEQKAKEVQEQSAGRDDSDVEMGNPEDEEKPIETAAMGNEEDSPQNPSNPVIVALSQEDEGLHVHPAELSPNTAAPDPSSQDPATDPTAEQRQHDQAAFELPLEDLMALAEHEIEDEMKERIARLLYLFHLRGAQHLVLGSFGTGVFQNNVELVAGIFYDLLARPGAKFHGVFANVVFAILGAETFKVFQDTFRDVAAEEVDEDENGMGSELEDGNDGKADEETTVGEESKVDGESTTNEQVTDGADNDIGQNDGRPEDSLSVSDDKQPRPEVETTAPTHPDASPAHMDVGSQTST